MAQNYGLGRGLSSLIPQKPKSAGEAGKTASASDEAGKTIDRPREDFNYFGSSPSAKRPDGHRSAAPRDESGAGAKNTVQEIEVSKIIPNPYQPRLEFVEAKMQELADSIKEHGIIQPLIVTEKGNGYELIAGERRLQAAKLAGVEKVPVIVREAGNQDKFELAIVENVQRHDLNLIEEAKSYKKMADEFDMSQEEIAKKIGKSRSSVANRMRLLELPVEIQKALISGRITEGHAKLLLAIPNPEKQRAFFEMILKDKLTVRQTEEKTKEVSVRPHKRKVTVDPEIKNLEDEISAAFGTRVKVKKSGAGGRIMIEYYSKEELDSILEKIK